MAVCHKCGEAMSEIEYDTHVCEEPKMFKSLLQRGTMYHCTQRKNLSSILKNGLIPKRPDIPNSIEGVYLSVVPFDWMHYTTKEAIEPGCHIEVNVIGLELIYDNGVLELEDYQRHPAFIYPGIIPPERFVNVSVSTVKNPCKFTSIIIKPLKKGNFRQLVRNLRTMTLCGADDKMRRACGFHSGKECTWGEHCSYQLGRKK